MDWASRTPGELFHQKGRLVLKQVNPVPWSDGYTETQKVTEVYPVSQSKWAIYGPVALAQLPFKKG